MIENPTELSFREWLVFGPLLVLLVGPLAANYVARPRLKFWQPTTMVCLTLLYYCVIGPWIALKNGDTVVVFKDTRPYYILGWAATLVGMLGYFAGYQAGAVGSAGWFGRALRGSRRRLKAFALPFLIVGILALFFMLGKYGLSLGRILNPAAGPARVGPGGEIGTFGNYIMHMTAFIGGYVLILVAAHRGLKMRILLPALGLLFVLLMYFAAIGFRGNLVEVLIGFGALLYILRGKRPSIPTMAVAGLAVVFMSGVILFSRNYFSGLSLDRLEEKSTSEILEGGFNDSMIFGTMGLCIDAVPERFDFYGAETLWLTVTMPIPRRLWPGKPTSSYLEDIQKIIAYGEDHVSAGQAIPNIGEYYMAYGWPGVFIGMFLFGVLCRKFWRWFVKHRNDVMAVVAYCTFFAWIFTFIHRGYLPQTVTDFCFSVLPLLIIRKFVGAIPIRRVLPARTTEETETREPQPAPLVASTAEKS